MEGTQASTVVQRMEVEPSTSAAQPVLEPGPRRPQPQPVPGASTLERPTFSMVARRGHREKVCDRVFRTFNIHVPQFKHVTRVGVVRSLSS